VLFSLLLYYIVFTVDFTVGVGQELSGRVVVQLAERVPDPLTPRIEDRAIPDIGNDPLDGDRLISRVTIDERLPFQLLLKLPVITEHDADGQWCFIG